jgi:ABC-2 type transport system permease protein
MRAPSAGWLLAGVCAVPALLAALSTQTEVSTASYGSDASESITQALGRYFDPTQDSLWGLAVGVLGMMAFGALTASSGHSDKVMIMWPTARPRAGTLYAAKALAVGMVAACVGLIASFGAFLYGQTAISSYGVSASLAQPGVFRAVIGGGLFLALGAVLGFGLGALQHAVASARSIWPGFAGACVAWAGLIAAPDLISAVHPGQARWLPGAAGTQIWRTKTPDPGALLAPWTGLEVFCGYAALAAVAGLIAFLGHTRQRVSSDQAGLRNPARPRM